MQLTRIPVPHLLYSTATQRVKDGSSPSRILGAWISLHFQSAQARRKSTDPVLTDLW
jgi:hypothetical protein